MVSSDSVDITTTHPILNISFPLLFINNSVSPCLALMLMTPVIHLTHPPVEPKWDCCKHSSPCLLQSLYYGWTHLCWSRSRKAQISLLVGKICTDSMSSRTWYMVAHACNMCQISCCTYHSILGPPNNFKAKSG